MTGYVDEVLARQALAAEEQAAAARLLERMRSNEWDAASAQAEPDERREPSRVSELSLDASGWPVERPGGDDAMEVAEVPAVIWTAKAQREGAAGDLLRRLQALAEPVSYQAASGEELPAARQVDGGEAAAPRYEAAAQALTQMERRLARAVSNPQAARTLPADGARDMEPGGTADAAALSRLYERDARRYDGFFELPL